MDKMQARAARAEREREFAAKHLARGTVGVVYATFPLTELDAGRIGKDAVLFLRCAPEDLVIALKAMQGLGFTYKSGFVVVMGKNCDSVLVGTRGKVPAPAPGTQFASVLKESDVGKMLERYYPNTPRG